MKKKTASIFKKLGYFFTGENRLSPKQKEAVEYIKALESKDYSSLFEQKVCHLIKRYNFYTFNYMSFMPRLLTNLLFLLVSFFVFVLLVSTLPSPFLPFSLPFLFPLVPASVCFFYVNSFSCEKNKGIDIKGIDLENIHPKLAKAIKYANTLPVYYFSDLKKLLNGNPEIKKDTLQYRQAKEIKALKSELDKIKNSCVNVKIKNPMYKDII